MAGRLAVGCEREDLEAKGFDHIASGHRPPLCIELNCAYPVGCEALSLICAHGASQSQMKEGASAAEEFVFVSPEIPTRGICSVIENIV